MFLEEQFTSRLCAGRNPFTNLAVNANPERAAHRELSCRGTYEVAGKTAHCAPGFLLAVCDTAFECVKVILKQP
jgi:hypothetical protein